MRPLPSGRPESRHELVEAQQPKQAQWVEPVCRQLSPDCQSPWRQRHTVGWRDRCWSLVGPRLGTIGRPEYTVLCIGCRLATGAERMKRGTGIWAGLRCILGEVHQPSARYHCVEIRLQKATCAMCMRRYAQPTISHPHIRRCNVQTFVWYIVRHSSLVTPHNTLHVNRRFCMLSLVGQPTRHNGMSKWSQKLQMWFLSCSKASVVQVERCWTGSGTQNDMLYVRYMGTQQSAHSIALKWHFL